MLHKTVCCVSLRAQFAWVCSLSCLDFKRGLAQTRSLKPVPLPSAH